MRYTVELNQQKSIEFQVLRRLNNSLVRSFLSSLSNPRQAQEKRFQEVIRALTPTQFSKEHQFNLHTSMEEFRERVPIRTYHELLPWLSPYHEEKSNSFEIRTSFPVKGIMRQSCLCQLSDALTRD